MHIFSLAALQLQGKQLWHHISFSWLSTRSRFRPVVLASSANFAIKSLGVIIIIIIRKTGRICLYRPEFHLELSHAFSHSRIKLQGLYLNLFGEVFGLGRVYGDNSMILALAVNTSCANSHTLTRWHLTKTKVFWIMEKCEFASIFNTCGRSRCNGTGSMESTTNCWVNQNISFSWVTNNNRHLPTNQVSSHVMANEICCDPMKVPFSRGPYPFGEGTDRPRCTAKHETGLLEPED